MSFSLVQITSTFIALFIIIDILGAIPILIGLKEKGIQIKSLSVSVVSFVILLIFLFAGDWILQLFNVDIQSFAVAGSLVIFIFAIEMVLDVEIYKNRGPEGSASFSHCFSAGGRTRIIHYPVVIARSLRCAEYHCSFGNKYHLGISCFEIYGKD